MTGQRQTDKETLVIMLDIQGAGVHQHQHRGEHCGHYIRIQIRITYNYVKQKQQQQIFARQDKILADQIERAIHELHFLLR
ncbi:hypothetical protein D3C74_423890 [compost metagenome]